ncbi:MAG: glycerophosphodiester phosphodiesterase [Candidatus Hodarchaeales archaeon]|jgi:glycerophosphoryl diester phosphodiesterase
MKKSKSWPLIIAHRGASGTFPENTIKAFQEAISSNADIIEVDLQLTKDNYVVLFHDRTVHRIFDQNLVNKSIRDYTLNELQKKDMGSWFDSSFSFCKIVTIEELFQTIPKKFPLILEIKGKEEEIVLKTSRFLIENKIDLDNGYISVRDLETFDKVESQLGSRYRIGLMQKKRSAKEFIEILQSKKISIAQIRPEYWNNEDFTLLETLPVEIMVSYADTYEEFTKLYKRNISGIFTNFPLKLNTFLLEQENKQSIEQ